jgi:hypothetical protein
MSIKQRKTLILLSGIGIAMLVCVFFAWDHPSQHARAWNLGFYLLLLLLNFWILYRHGLNGPAPNTLIKLFPKEMQQTTSKDHTL